jgi:hypothetical protein
LGFGYALDYGKTNSSFLSALTTGLSYLRGQVMELQSRDVVTLLMPLDCQVKVFVRDNPLHVVTATAPAVNKGSGGSGTSSINLTIGNATWEYLHGLSENLSVTVRYSVLDL